MRFAAAAFVLALMAAPAGADTWTSGWDAPAGADVATQRNKEGQVVTVFSCRPPTGDLTISDYELGRRRGSEAEVRLGEFSQRFPARQNRDSNGRALVITLQQSPPVIAGGAQPHAPMSIRVGGNSHTLAQGGAWKLREVAVQCWANN